MTYIYTWQGQEYLATVIDCATRKVIGWAMDDNYRTPLITRAIEMAARNVVLSADAVFNSDYAEVDVKPENLRMACSGSCAITLYSSAPRQMAACSAECGVASCPRSPTGAHGSSHARPRSRRRSKPLLSPGGPTTFRTHVCPPGSTAACIRLRSPNGPGTASTSFCGSTPSASWARMSSPSAASAKPCARTDMRRLTILDFGTYLAQRPAYGHLGPHTVAQERCCARSRPADVSAGQMGRTWTLERRWAERITMRTAILW